MIDALKAQLSAMSPIHFVGVLGTGMRPLAELCSRLGAKVSGSDRNITDLDLFSGSSIKFCLASEQLDQVQQAKSVVYSSAITNDHPEVLLAKSRDILILHRSELLSLVSGYYDLIAVAGSHGKTTTTCILAHFLSHAKLDPSFLAGASFKTTNGQTESFRVGASDLLLIESDESDGSFLRYKPRLSVVTNIGLDHLDFYKDVSDIERAFSSFVANTKPNGVVITQASCKNVLQQSLPPSVSLVTFGFEDFCDLSIGAIEKTESQTRISLNWRGHRFKIGTSLIGNFNCLNLAAASAAFLQLGGSIEELVGASPLFTSVRRRQDLIFRKKSCVYFDDYAHNPDKVRECVLAFREWFASSNLIVVFQPHRFSRFKALFNEFQSSFAGANRVIVTPVYGAGEKLDDSLDFDEFASGVSTNSGCQVSLSGSLESAGDMVLSNLSPVKTNIVLAVGAGDITKLSAILEKRI